MLRLHPRLHPRVCGWAQTHLEWPEQQVEFSGFNVHREATDEQCPDLGTETTEVRARLTEGEDWILPELREEICIFWASRGGK